VSGHEEVAVTNRAGTPWTYLVSPPPETATIAFGPRKSVEALAGDSTILTVWALDDRQNAWTKSQVIHVPIQFGSSSQ